MGSLKSTLTETISGGVEFLEAPEFSAIATIAARADNHIKVEKKIQDNRTFTRVFGIKGDMVKKEISRMLAGDSSGDVSLKHAEELLEKYGR